VGNKGPNPSLNTSQHVILLPYIEQEAASELINLQKNTPNTLQRIVVFTCPSDGETLSHNQGRGRPDNRTRHNIRANTGSWIDTGENNGIFYHYPNPPSVDGLSFLELPGQLALKYIGVTVSEILDGTSYTAMFSERLVGDEIDSVVSEKRDTFLLAGLTAGRTDAVADSYRTACEALAPPLPTGATNWSMGAATWHNGTLGLTWYNHVSPPNARSCGQNQNGNFQRGTVGPTSNHSGGVNLVLCDGSARFVRDAISIPVWRNLGNRKDGQPSKDY
jgi:prepilin-type processing-associated H-X9-DG protein